MGGWRGGRGFFGWLEETGVVSARSIAVEKVRGTYVGCSGRGSCGRQHRHDLRLCEITIHGSPQHGGDVWTEEAEFDVVDADPNCEKSVFFFPWGVRGCGDEVGGEGGGLVDEGLNPGAEGGNDGGVDGGAAVGEVVGEEGGRVVSIYEVAARRG